MSRIYFHTQEFDDVELRGSERAYMGVLLNDVMLAVIGDLRHAEPWLKPLLPADHYLRQSDGDRFAQHAGTWLRVGMSGSLQLPGGPIEPWTIALNTGCALGDEMRLFARLHGQCEIHCWIEGEKDKHWLAEIIHRGIETRVMRQQQGWEGVRDLLRRNGDFPVVCSYSVCDQFPNWGSLPKDHPLRQGTEADKDERYDRWEEMDPSEQWKACMEGLRASSGGLQITRKGWKDFQFGDGTSAFNLCERAKAATASAA